MTDKKLQLARPAGGGRWVSPVDFYGAQGCYVLGRKQRGALATCAFLKGEPLRIQWVGHGWVEESLQASMDVLGKDDLVVALQDGAPCDVWTITEEDLRAAGYVPALELEAARRAREASESEIRRTHEIHVMKLLEKNRQAQRRTATKKPPRRSPRGKRK